MPHYFSIILETMNELDKGAEVYLFGSVAEGRHLLSSDIDILVVTEIPPEVVISTLWKKGVEDPFEIHVISGNDLEVYRRRAKLISLKSLVQSGISRRT